MDPVVLAQVLRQLPIPDDANLLVGHEGADDAAVYRVNDDLAIIQTLDFFTPMVDDPYLYGQIAAANSLSDVYAMGGKPILALNILAFPDRLGAEVLGEVLRGGADKVKEAGANTVGGHTIIDEEPKFGLSVMGFVHPERVWTNAGMRGGDLLFLTKKLGTGVLNTALKADMLDAKQIDALAASMAELNKAAAEAGMDAGVSAATDITGFGFLGHAMEMAQSSRRDIEIDLSAFRFLDGAKEMAEMGFVPSGSYRNRKYIDGRCFGLEEQPRWLADLLVDPQTSGGLLLAVPESSAAALQESLQQRGVFYRRVGRALPTDEGKLYLR